MEHGSTGSIENLSRVRVPCSCTHEHAARRRKHAHEYIAWHTTGFQQSWLNTDEKPRMDTNLREVEFQFVFIRVHSWSTISFIRVHLCSSVVPFLAFFLAMREP